MSPIPDQCPHCGATVTELMVPYGWICNGRPDCPSRVQQPPR
jgi:hypothetical protein